MTEVFFCTQLIVILSLSGNLIEKIPKKTAQCSVCELELSTCGHVPAASAANNSANTTPLLCFVFLFFPNSLLS